MSDEKRYTRFSIFQRVEHILLIASFTLLGLTGLPQKYADTPFCAWLIAALGGIEAIRMIHRTAAAVFVLESVYHFAVAGYKLYVLRVAATMVPNLKDATDALQAFLYNLGFTTKAPKLPRYNFAEKAEYWALIWGLVVMAGTGFILWNPIWSARFLPGQIIPASKAAHGGEAVLAVAAIILWHFYNVHIKHLNLAMFKGNMTRHQMEEEHGQELEEIEAGMTNPVPEATVMARRVAIYTPIAVVFMVLGFVLVYEVATFESTAITTLPKNQIGEVYVPQTPTPIPPTPTPLPPKPTATPDTTGAALPPQTWASGVGAIFDTNCSACHGAVAGLGLQTYADAMKGGVSGAVIKPGDPDTSLVVTTVKGGDHAGKFSADELQVVISWIKANAPEK
jgi:cytochrome b subunit of formate dehydrogenase